MPFREERRDRGIKTSYQEKTRNSYKEYANLAAKHVLDFGNPQMKHNMDQFAP